MSQKLWNQAKRKSKVLSEEDLQTEYKSILGELTQEAVDRKNEIIYISLEQKWESIWDLVDKEYRKINGSEQSKTRQAELERIAGQHSREFTRVGGSVWIVELEDDAEDEPEVSPPCQNN